MNTEEFFREYDKINHGIIYNWKVKYPRWHYLEGRVLREDTPPHVLEEARKLDKLLAEDRGISHFFRNFVPRSELKAWREFWKEEMRKEKEHHDKIIKE